MYIKRKSAKYIKKVIEKESSVILIGTRQVGKTTLLKKIEGDFVSEGKKTFYFNLELPSSLNIFSSGVEGFLEYIRARGAGNIKDSSKKVYVFIDEFQYIVSAGKFLKALIDNFPSIKIIASGSSSVEIQKSMEESLVGRKRIIRIFPLNFEEFLYFNKAQEAEFFTKLNIHHPLKPALSNRFEELFYQFVVWGGMPRVVLEEDYQERREILEDVCSSYLQKDIKGLLGSENIAAFNKLMILLAQESSSLLSLNSMSGILGIKRAELERHLFILENTFVNFLLPSFFTNKRKELSKIRKSFFYDTGIRNYLVKDLSRVQERFDKGKLLESAVYNEFSKDKKAGMELYHWRTQHQTEIDFVIKYDNKIIPVEVKSGTLNHVPMAVSSFAKQYKSPFAVVINKDYWSEEIVKGLKVYFMPFFLACFIPGLVMGGES